jgi:hypothetical protein
MLNGSMTVQTGDLHEAATAQSGTGNLSMTVQGN